MRRSTKVLAIASLALSALTACTFLLSDDGYYGFPKDGGRDAREDSAAWTDAGDAWEGGSWAPVKPVITNIKDLEDLTVLSANIFFRSKGSLWSLPKDGVASPEILNIEGDADVPLSLSSAGSTRISLMLLENDAIGGGKLAIRSSGGAVTHRLADPMVGRSDIVRATSSTAAVGGGVIVWTSGGSLHSYAAWDGSFAGDSGVYSRPLDLSDASLCRECVATSGAKILVTTRISTNVYAAKLVPACDGGFTGGSVVVSAGPFVLVQVSDQKWQAVVPSDCTLGPELSLDGGTFEVLHVDWIAENDSGTGDDSDSGSVPKRVYAAVRRRVQDGGGCNVHKIVLSSRSPSQTLDDSTVIARLETCPHLMRAYGTSLYIYDGDMLGRVDIP